MPTVSVVIPTHNRASLLKEALRSVLQQTYQDIEVIIVDDGSTNDTRNQMASFLNDPPRVRVLYQENRGLAGARNTGICSSQGDFIALLDDDDIWLPEKLEKQMHIMQSDEQVDIVYCDFRFIDMEGNQLPIHYKRPPTHGSLYEDLMYGNVITGSGSAVLIRTKCFADTGLFDENLKACEDQDLWRRMALSHRFQYVDEVLLYIRWHATNMQKNSVRMVNAKLKYLDKLKNETPSSYRHHLPEVAYKTYFDSVRSLIETKEPSKAISITPKIAQLGPGYSIRFLKEFSLFTLRALKHLDLFKK